MAITIPSCFGRLDDSSFPLPVPGLLADMETGDGGVRMTDDFSTAPPLTRVRLAQQWLRDFRDIKDAALVELFRDYAATRPELSIVEQMDAFREDCRDEAVTCPSDLAILLQRF